jgi:hypothetical protein
LREPVDKQRQVWRRERIYHPSTIDEAYEKFPEEGKLIRIVYKSVGGGTASEELGEVRVRKRKAVVVKKHRHENGAHFTVEMIPENKIGCHGRYRMTFLFVDILLGRVKVQEVGG